MLHIQIQKIKNASPKVEPCRIPDLPINDLNL